LGKFAPKPFPLKAITAKAEGLSYAEIKRAVDESIKDAVMHDEERVKADVLTRAFDERRKFSFRMNNKRVVPNHVGSTTS
jgi:AAA+ superfamily predicted ATPase